MHPHRHRGCATPYKSWLFRQKRLASNASPAVPSRPFRLAVVGSGPAGFYAASRVLRQHNQTVVDMYERLPVPFGLTRFGVAPDHPEVKNCQDRFEEIANLPNFNFIGNVHVGRHLSLTELRARYDAVLLAYGASQDRLLNVDGEQLPGVHSAREFVAWYNGLPESAHLVPQLSQAAEAVVIGQGNVALDVARMLLSDVDQLRHTDTPEPVLQLLSRNSCKTVHIVGRRGPCQAAFTIKEIRELPSLDRSLNPVPRQLFPPDPTILPRPRQRINQLLAHPRNIALPGSSKTIHLDFFLSPLRFEADQAKRLARSIFSPTRFAGSGAEQERYLPDTRVQADPTQSAVTIHSQLAFRSVGYKAEPLIGMQEAGIPFDQARGIIPNIRGRVVRPAGGDGDGDGALGAATHVVVPGVYAAGWVKCGPTGVIATTMQDAFETADAIVTDLHHHHDDATSPGLYTRPAGSVNETSLGDDDDLGWPAVRRRLGSAVRPVTWTDWRIIDAVERERGRKLGKPREKITTVREMLSVLDG